jgi:3-hydroxyacyl-[acyl-carrier-protein] dehydratase
MSDQQLTPVEVREIMEMLPHRYPFQLVDRVIFYELEPEKTLRAIKNVTINEPYFPGHFPDSPIMPGVLIIEALAQASGILAFLAQAAKKSGSGLYYLVKIDKARFSKTVTPGDQLILEVTQKRLMRNMGKYECRALVDGKVVASAEILCAGKSGE